MLRKVEIDRKPNGRPIAIPVQMNESTLDQQVKTFIEYAYRNPFDGQLHISLFRKYHGGDWTRRILEAVLQELHQPSIEIDIPDTGRDELIPYFGFQLERHQALQDSEFGYPGDRSKLPI